MYLTQGLHRSLQQTPDAVMTVFGERTRTVREFADRVARFASALRGLDVRSGGRVAILANNSDNYAEVLLAVPWADAVLNPVNTRWSVAEIAYSLADCACDVLVVDNAYAHMVPALQAEYPGLRTVIFCGDGETPAGMCAYEMLIAESAAVEDVRRSGDALAGIFYTGGTTGFPKGVMLSHANIVTSVLGAAASRSLFRSGGTYLHVAPMFHLADFTGGMIQVLVGGTHVMLPSFDAKSVLRTIERYSVTGAVLVPAMIQAVVNHPDVAVHDLSSIENIMYGASPISENLLTRALSTFSSGGLTQAYGMTELAGLATLLAPEDHVGDRMRSAGRALPHTEVRISGRDGVDAARGEVGEIIVRGGHVMQGYWGRPEETADALVDGWMHTGDLGYMDDAGYVFVVDRSKDMIITGGENVYSAEVENALSSHPAVLECAVIALPDERWGERVHAVVVPRPGHDIEGSDLRDHVKSLVAGYKAPRSFEFVESLPRTTTGKILKRTLREAHVQGGGAAGASG
ncbi:long-chain-fatty-acid--CoA ligase [Rhodococcus opacus]|uniref:Long-chain-fatty-acid--CoA ligase n=1 Tax=Rhodococcus opacus TaxID=37919 RepID=A0AAX3YU86_RHOOP|nr:long-chain-fatty-acid--CoA ligase [Rhodococcus opacus]MCZ4590203.1 long-chain-fatty-acid--CoA ligase [Rhodococcus opacus]WLF52308.1 long-chain-fatty-acid--CoA ligase [Rhodococcus opacus]